MILRRLELKDAPKMLEWMQDKDTIRYFNNDFSKMKIEDCYQFVENSKCDKINFHYAICSSEDEYIGTISLKNIDYKNRNAEYAIVINKKAMGSGIAKEATDEIIKIAFKELNLHKVYLCVSAKNKRAISFYEKYGMLLDAVFKKHIFTDGEYYDLLWFCFFDQSKN